MPNASEDNIDIFVQSLFIAISLILPYDLLFASKNYLDNDFCLTSGFLSISNILIKLVDVTITKNSPLDCISLGLPSFSNYLISLIISPLWL